MKAKPKKIIKKKKVSGSSREDKMMVLLEDMRDEIKLVAEGHSILKRQLDSMQLDSDKFKEETRDNFNKMNKRFGIIDQNFKLVFEHFSNIEDELVEVKFEIKELRKVLSNKADLERLAMLEERVRKLEMQQVILRDEAKDKYKN